MDKAAKVFVRSDHTSIPVSITDQTKPVIDRTVKLKWQRILNLIAKALHIPSSLIMQITEETMEVFLSSDNPDNPYHEGGSDSLGHGLYCETVIGSNKELLVTDALADEEWQDNPDVALNMISYYGLPLKWPDQQFFGTICVLDNKANPYNDIFKELLQEFSYSIERDLELLCHNVELRYLADMDTMTKIYNRGKIESLLVDEFNRASRHHIPFTIVLFDLNNFKSINDQYGHSKGDEVLRTFAHSVASRIRAVDKFGRWGGDEFMLICPNTDRDGCQSMIESIKEEILEKLGHIVLNTSYSYGIGAYNDKDQSIDDMIVRADNALYDNKTGMD